CRDPAPRQYSGPSPRPGGHFMPGTLYIVGTPIGNLEDLTQRAARVLGEAALVVAEDTRQTRKLLSHLGLHKRLLSYNEHSPAQRTRDILKAVLAEDVALVSDAGVPLVSDPGAALVRAAAEQGTRVVPVPGPSALTAALSAAGMPADAFHFLGFPPRARKAKRSLFERYERDPLTLVLFEAPHRLEETLEDLRTVLGDRETAVCRELTKLYEEVFRGTLMEALAYFTEPRGEFVLVLAGATPHPAQTETDIGAVRESIAKLKASGTTRRDAVEQVTQAYGVSRREASRLYLEA
ncbi:MAG: 16S rRNA (cytidine(1402)-2'-O)-methyltransferase, partial [Dehalococcoidia bacterium]